MSPVQHCVSGARAELLRSQPFSDGKLRFAWRAAVGSVVDRATTVEVGTEGELEVRAVGAWSREVRRLSPLIVSRLAVLLGPGVVTKISVRQK
jgi:hypothetical protein